MTCGNPADLRPMAQTRAGWKTLVVHAAAALVLPWLFGVVSPVLFANAERTFDRDEARHAVNGLQIAADIVHPRGAELLGHFYRQQWHPPALSVYLAPFLIAVGPSYWAARFPMVMLLMANCVLAYRSAMRIWHSPRIALVALVLVSTSSLMWEHGLLCMEEMLAVCGTSLVVVAWARRQRQGSERQLRLAEWILGLCIALTSFARTSTGLFVAGTVLAAVWSMNDSVRSKMRATARAFGPVVAALALWWCTPAKLPGFFDYLRVSRAAFELLSGGELASFWQEMVPSFAVAPSLASFSRSRWLQPHFAGGSPARGFSC